MLRRQEEAIARAVKFLAADQLDYGEFPSYRYRDKLLRDVGEFDSSPFATCFILYALGFVNNAAASRMAHKGVNFLTKEAEAPGVWRYWTSRNGARIDADLDDTCCASFVVRRYLPNYPLKENEGVILANRTEEGLFKTWLREPQSRNDIDSVVNSNILLYLGERRETQTACRMLNQIIAENRESNSYWYYLDPLALYYMISRAYFNGVRGLGESSPAIIERVRARQLEDGSFGDELLTGMALCTLLNYGVTEVAEKTKLYLIETQQQAGSWQRRPFYAGPEPPTQHSFWWAAEGITTAFCLEALARCFS